MPQLIWTLTSLQGVQRCYRFLASKNPDAASRAVRAIREGMQIVAAQPGVGRPADKMVIRLMTAATAFPTTLPAHRLPAVLGAHALLRTSRIGHPGCGAAAGAKSGDMQCRV